MGTSKEKVVASTRQTKNDVSHSCPTYAVLEAHERTSAKLADECAVRDEIDRSQTTLPQINRQQISDAISRRPSARFSTPPVSCGTRRRTDGRASRQH